MTDPNLAPCSDTRPDDRPHVHTTVQAPSARGGGAAIAFIVGGLVVLFAVIAVFIYAGRAPAPDVNRPDIDVDLQAPALPEVPTPDAPPLPRPVDPPTTDAPA